MISDAAPPSARPSRAPAGAPAATHGRSATDACGDEPPGSTRGHPITSSVLAEGNGASAVPAYTPGGAGRMEMAAPFGITICGIEELTGHCEAGATHVLSILDPAWPVPEAFGRYGEHARLELRFHDVIKEAPGMVAPTAEHVARLLAFGRDLSAGPADDARLLVHCHMGVSRSTASTALVLAQALPDRPGGEVFRAVLRV